MTNKELMIYKWVVNNWDKLTKNAESWGNLKRTHSVPISDQLQRRFNIDAKTASKIAIDANIWMQTAGRV